MKFSDIISEAPKHGVDVSERDIYWCFDGETASAHMTKYASSNAATRRKWVGFSKDHNGEKIRFEGSKASVANWCLDIAANGAP